MTIDDESGLFGENVRVFNSGAAGVIDVQPRPRRSARARGTAQPRPLSDLILVPWWEDADSGADWETVTINGTQWAGLAKVSGAGIGRKLDVKSPGGSDGARIRDKGYEPGRFEITFTLWTEAHLQALGALIPAIHPRRAGRERPAVDVYHPALLLAGITRAVVEKVGILQQGSTVGTWELKVSLIEYQQPTPRPTAAVAPRSGANSLADVQNGFPPPRDAAPGAPRPSATNANP